MPVKIFFCYAREDEKLLNQLKTHLSNLRRQGLIDLWHDREISAGTEWKQQIEQRLDEAQIILLLVSPDFMNSDYCYSIEMKRALERHGRNEAKVIPVILRPVYWYGEPLGRLQVLPTDGKPVRSPHWHSEDEAFHDVVVGIQKVVSDLSSPDVSTRVGQTSDGREMQQHHVESRPHSTLPKFEIRGTHTFYDTGQVQLNNLNLKVGLKIGPGKQRHKSIEDSLFALPDPRSDSSQPAHFGLFVVADGMGGHNNGRAASRLAIKNFVDYVLSGIPERDNLDEDDYKNLLLEGVRHANLAIHQRNIEEQTDMGTTITAALVVGSTAYIVNVGDSRAYLFSEPEGLQQITRDHSLAASQVEAGLIEPDEIYTHPSRHQIYRSLGEKPTVETDMFPIELQPDDMLLLCSDGLWEMVRDPEIQSILESSLSAQKRVEEDLYQAALNGGGEDDVSIIVASITEVQVV